MHACMDGCGTPKPIQCLLALFDVCIYPPCWPQANIPLCIATLVVEGIPDKNEATRSRRLATTEQARWSVSFFSMHGPDSILTQIFFSLLTRQGVELQSVTTLLHC